MTTNPEPTTWQQHIEAADELMTTYMAEIERLEKLRLLTMSQVGQHLKTAREMTGIGLRPHARKVGCSAVYMLNVERGDRITNRDWIKRYRAALEPQA